MSRPYVTTLCPHLTAAFSLLLFGGCSGGTLRVVDVFLVTPGLQPALTFPSPDPKVGAGSPP